jgi:hypothetical protein
MDLKPESAKPNGMTWMLRPITALQSIALDAVLMGGMYYLQPTAHGHPRFKTPTSFRFTAHGIFNFKWNTKMKITRPSFNGSPGLNCPTVKSQILSFLHCRLHITGKLP